MSTNAQKTGTRYTPYLPTTYVKKPPKLLEQLGTGAYMQATNGANSIALPKAVAEQMQMRQMQAQAILESKTMIAKDLYGHLLAVEYQAAVMTALKKADPFGAKGLVDECDEDSFREAMKDFSINLARPASVAVDAAVALMKRLGLATELPPAPAISEEA